MKRFHHIRNISLILLLISFFMVPHVTAADTFAIDGAHSFVNFKITHLGMGNAYGRFNSITGSLMMESKAITQVSVTVDATKVDTNNEKRDQHIKGPDFFNVSKYPTITFKSKSVKKGAGSTFEISGDLTFLGKTKPLTVTATQIGFGKDPWKNTRTGFETTFTIKRTDFGNNFMLKGLSDEVVLTVSLEAIKK